MNFFKIFSAVLLLAAAPLNAATTIKFATLAPAGSTWMKVMKEFSADVSAKTGGAVQFKIYPGGVQGDEKDVLRKIRLGQLQAGGFTGVGIGEIAPELRIMDAPLLFKSSDEADYIYKTFDKQFRSALEKKGYVLLGWAEVGFVYFYTNKPVTKPEDLAGVKMWLWEGDPTAEAAFKTIKITAVPLSITDVMTSLQTGLVSGVYGSPLSVVAMQWFTRTKYMFSIPLANAMGAVLVSKTAYDRLTPQQKKVLTDSGEQYFTRLTKQSRQDNTDSITALKKEHITVTDPANQAVREYFENAGRTARQSLTGKLYSKELLSQVEKALADYRKSAKHKK